MPPAKKPTTTRNKDKISASSSKPSVVRRNRASSKTSSTDTNRIVTGKPLSNPYPTAFKPNPQPLPMPVEPGRLPSQSYEPLIRTTYNADWIKRVGIILGIVVVAGVAYAGWTYRSFFQNLIISDEAQKPEPVVQLKISPTPAPNLQRLNQLSQNLSPQASASETGLIPVDQASSSAELSLFLQAQSSAELSRSLDNYINQLSLQKVNINNLDAYRDKINKLIAQDQSEAAHDWLVEAVLHAHELSILHGYYQ